MHTRRRAHKNKAPVRSPLSQEDDSLHSDRYMPQAPGVILQPIRPEKSLQSQPQLHRDRRALRQAEGWLCLIAVHVQAHSNKRCVLLRRCLSPRRPCPSATEQHRFQNAVRQDVARFHTVAVDCRLLQTGCPNASRSTCNWTQKRKPSQKHPAPLPSYPVPPVHRPRQATRSPLPGKVRSLPVLPPRL